MLLTTVFVIGNR